MKLLSVLLCLLINDRALTAPAGSGPSHLYMKDLGSSLEPSNAVDELKSANIRLDDDKELCEPCEFTGRRECSCFNRNDDHSQGGHQVEPRQAPTSSINTVINPASPAPGQPLATVTIVHAVDTTLATTTITLTVPSLVSIIPSAMIAVPSTVTVPDVVLVSDTTPISQSTIPFATPFPLGNSTVFLNGTGTAIIFTPTPLTPSEITLPTLATPIIITDTPSSPLTTPAPGVLSTITVNPPPLSFSTFTIPAGGGGTPITWSTLVTFPPQATTITIPAIVPVSGSPATAGPVAISTSTVTLPTITVSLPAAQASTVTVSPVIIPALSSPAPTPSTTITVTVLPPTTSLGTIPYTPGTATTIASAAATTVTNLIPIPVVTVTAFSSLPPATTSYLTLPGISSSGASDTVTGGGGSGGSSVSGRTITLVETVPYSSAGANGDITGYSTVTSLVVIPDELSSSSSSIIGGGDVVAVSTQGLGQQGAVTTVTTPSKDGQRQCT
ncbi:hypothetical protein QBC42DRAFT_257348 [Cladorrhinum samala]|uniref:Uncharacterized protein n=1 Tax=Cladorrhinum samala TaxID=585594 RepID=A0AAV9H6T2_9PEZI|nr:hypothetical protein QBC42DRAFT_257348 [Cladorrhinum samala]